MKTIKKTSCLGAALLMGVSIGTAYAEDGDMTQTQERTRAQINLQEPTSDFGRALNREQTKNQNQNQYQYKWMNGSSAEQSGSGEGSMNRYNTMDRSMQHSTSSGSMTRQGSANRSMGGGRR